MAGNAADEAAAPKGEGVLKTIAQGLAKEPAYLLMFSICFLMFGGGAGVLATAILQQSVPGQIVGVVMFAIALAGAYAAINRVNKRPTDATEPAPEPAAEEVAISDPELLRALQGILRNLAGASAIENEVFAKFIRDRANAFELTSRSWAQGSFSVDREAGAVLVRLYRAAKQNVFATSIPEYNTAWSVELGDRILDAHEQSGARVDRVFIFERPEDVAPEMYAFMERQEKLRTVTVRVLFYSDAPQQLFPPTVSKDFTLIDNGAIIGVTDTFAQGDTTATWYFGDHALALQLCGLRDEIMQYSRPLRSFQPTAVAHV